MAKKPLTVKDYLKKRGHSVPSGTRILRAYKDTLIAFTKSEIFVFENGNWDCGVPFSDSFDLSKHREEDILDLPYKDALNQLPKEIIGGKLNDS